MLIRDDAQMLINEVHALCIETAEHYELATSKPISSEATALLAKFAAERRQLAAELASYICAHDDLPRLPDPDRETLGNVVDELRALFTQNEQQIFMASTRKLEGQLSQKLTESFKLKLDQEVFALLQRIKQHNETVRQQLPELE